MWKPGDDLTAGKLNTRLVDYAPNVPIIMVFKLAPTKPGDSDALQLPGQFGGSVVYQEVSTGRLFVYGEDPTLQTYDGNSVRVYIDDFLQDLGSRWLDFQRNYTFAAIYVSSRREWQLLTNNAISLQRFNCTVFADSPIDCNGFLDWSWSWSILGYDYTSVYSIGNWNCDIFTMSSADYGVGGFPQYPETSSSLYYFVSVINMPVTGTSVILQEPYRPEYFMLSMSFFPSLAASVPEWSYVLNELGAYTLRGKTPDWGNFSIVAHRGTNAGGQNVWTSGLYLRSGDVGTTSPTSVYFVLREDDVFGMVVEIRVAADPDDVTDPDAGTLIEDAIWSMAIPQGLINGSLLRRNLQLIDPTATPAMNLGHQDVCVGIQLSIPPASSYREYPSPINDILDQWLRLTPPGTEPPPPSGVATYEVSVEVNGLTEDLTVEVSSVMYGPGPLFSFTAESFTATSVSADIEQVYFNLNAVIEVSVPRQSLGFFMDSITGESTEARSISFGSFTVLYTP